MRKFKLMGHLGKVVDEVHMCVRQNLQSSFCPLHPLEYNQVDWPHSLLHLIYASGATVRQLWASGQRAYFAVFLFLLQYHAKTPELMQMSEHLFVGGGQGNALVGGVAQGQGAVAADGDIVDLDIGLMLAQIVLGASFWRNCR